MWHWSAVPSFVRGRIYVGHRNKYITSFPTEPYCGRVINCTGVPSFFQQCGILAGVICKMKPRHLTFPPLQCSHNGFNMPRGIFNLPQIPAGWTCCVDPSTIYICFCNTHAYNNPIGTVHLSCRNTLSRSPQATTLFTISAPQEEGSGCAFFATSFN